MVRLYFDEKTAQKIGKIITGAITCAVSLSACAGPSLTALDVQIAQAQYAAQQACYAAEAEARRAASGYDDARDQALIIMAAALAGKQGDRCRMTNVYDSRAAIAAAQNQTLGKIVPGVVSGAVAIGGLVAGADVLKTALRQSGNSTSIQGENNSVTSYDTRSTVSNRQGDNASLRAPTSGPDLSSTTTTTGVPLMVPTAMTAASSRPVFSRTCSSFSR